MRYLSVCSGIEAATVAWHQMGWQPVGFSEIEPFPSAVLKHHYPNTPNLGDMTKYKEWNIEHPDLLVGGTPCQSFSVAGLRKGLEDPRGNLALVYCGILDHFRPRWFVWENVPGVLSSAGGRDFGSFLGALAQLGYGFAYRVLDAQWFGVAQRRRRVFVVGHLGDWRPAAAVLFERESLRRNTAPSREKRQEFAKCLTTGIGKRYDSETDTRIPVAQPIAFHATQDPINGPISPALGSNMYAGVAQPFQQIADCLTAAYGTKWNGNASATHGSLFAAQHMAVRRLTPVECERLQGFPDNYTAIPWRNKAETPDGPRYKALGNSMAVPVMKWIKKQIEAIR
jgi:DNA (cytosine-5)-methyltransferase 1